MADAGNLERVIWLLWLQGFENAPEIVRLCTRSWKARNPTWSVIELCDNNLSQYVDQESLSTLRGLRLTPQKRSNLIRMYLLSRWGGVWADATCLCRRSLDDWLLSLMDSGFFAFRFPADAWLRSHDRFGPWALRRRGGNKILANWFLAAARGNQLVTTIYEEHMDFFLRDHFTLQFDSRGLRRIRALRRVLNRNAKLAQIWTSPVLTRLAKVYPYHIMHFHIAKIVTQNGICRDIWSRTPVLQARGPLSLVRVLTSPISEEQTEDIRSARQPLYKLTWKYSPEEYRDGCVLDYLMRSTPA